MKWDRLPEKWRPFVEACLSDNPRDRPQDFLELEDWLTDPELALTHQSSQGYAPGKRSPTIIEEETGPLSAMLERLHNPPIPTQKDLQELLHQAETAITGSRWKAARKLLEKALPIDGNHAPTHVKMAIVALELGDEKKAERHYNLAKQLDPKLAKQFREHLAFKM